MAIIDLSILRSQLHQETLRMSLKQNTAHYWGRPKQFIQPCGIMFGVYSMTYCTANSIEYYCNHTRHDSKIPVFVGTSIVNIICIGIKDVLYPKFIYSHLQLYTDLGKKQKPITPVFPMLSKFLFSVRDATTIVSNFVFKKYVVEQLETTSHLSFRDAEIVSSFAIPAVSQIVSTPFHMLAFDVFQTPQSSIIDRLRRIQISYSNVLLGRMVRTIPAFGIGGFINDMIRKGDKK
jgi:hypothetical protein